MDQKLEPLLSPNQYKTVWDPSPSQLQAYRDSAIQAMREAERGKLIVRMFSFILKISGISPIMYSNNHTFLKFWSYCIDVFIFICFFMCGLNLFDQTRSYRNFITGFAVLYLHFIVWLTLVRVRKILVLPSWVFLMKRAANDELAGATVRWRMACLIALFVIGQIIAVTFIYMGWSVPITSSIVNPNAGETELRTRIILIVHSMSLNVLIIPWVWVLLCDAFIFYLFSLITGINTKRIVREIEREFDHATQVNVRKQDFLNKDQAVISAVRRGTPPATNGNMSISSLSVVAPISPKSNTVVEEKPVENHEWVYDFNFSALVSDKICTIINSIIDPNKHICHEFSALFVHWNIACILMFIAGTSNLIGSSPDASVSRWWASNTNAHDDSLFHVFQDLFLLCGFVIQLWLNLVCAKMSREFTRMEEHLNESINKMKNPSTSDRTIHNAIMNTMNQVPGGFICYGEKITPWHAIEIILCTIFVCAQVNVWFLQI